MTTWTALTLAVSQIDGNAPGPCEPIVADSRPAEARQRVPPVELDRYIECEMLASGKWNAHGALSPAVPAKRRARLSRPLQSQVRVCRPRRPRRLCVRRRRCADGSDCTRVGRRAASRLRSSESVTMRARCPGMEARSYPHATEWNGAFFFRRARPSAQSCMAGALFRTTSALRKSPPSRLTLVKKLLRGSGSALAGACPVLLACCVAGCAGARPPASLPPEPTSTSPLAATNSSGAAPIDTLVEAIVYTTLRPTNWDLYLFDEPRATPRRLTDDAALDYNAVFSPDGRWVVFTSERGGNADLYALNLTVKGPLIRLTRHFAMDDAATFSPDGRRLAFVSTRDGDADIFVMPFFPGDSTAEQRTVNVTRHSGGDFNPAFSPDGRSIAFSRQVEFTIQFDPQANVVGPFGADLYVMAADGTNPRRLSEPGALSGSPAWSSDGGTIYYHRYDFRGVEIRRIAPDGSGDASLATGGLSPAVRPDGRVAFSQQQAASNPDIFDRLRTGRIYSVAADGTDLRLESDTVHSYFAPDFDRGTGRMLSHGSAPAGDPDDLRQSPTYFAPPDARRQVRLPDRTLEVRGIRGQFPALTPAGAVISAYPESPLITSAIDGSAMRDLFAPVSGMAWGAAIDRKAGSIVVAVGPPFAGPPFGPAARVDIWKLNLDGSGAVNLTSDAPSNDALPHISADGRRIVFRSDRDGNKEIYVMDGDGTDVRRLTETPGTETMPALSPDGEWVVFSTDRAGGMKLYLQRVDGSEGRFLEPDRLDLKEFSMHPRFSPDGKWVVFTSSRGGFNDEWPLTWFPQPYGELWAVPVTRGVAVRLTHDKWEDGPSDWGFLRVRHRSR